MSVVSCLFLFPQFNGIIVQKYNHVGGTIKMVTDEWLGYKTEYINEQMSLKVLYLLLSSK